MTLPQANDQRMAGRILELVCDTYGLTRDELLLPAQTRRIAQPRQIAAYLMHCMTRLTGEEIAVHFTSPEKLRGHHYVESAVKQVKKRLAGNSLLYMALRRLKRTLRIAYGEDQTKPEPETCSHCGHVLH